MFNQVTLIGNVGQDPEIRSMNNGGEVCNFSVATSERWKDKSSGEKKEVTTWHRLVIFEKGLIGIAKRYISKGDQVFVVGQLQLRKWTDSEGHEKWATEIVLKSYGHTLRMLGGKKDKPNNDRTQGGDNGQDYDDDIPF